MAKSFIITKTVEAETSNEHWFYMSKAREFTYEKMARSHLAKVLNDFRNNPNYKIHIAISGELWYVIQGDITFTFSLRTAY